MVAESILQNSIIQYSNLRHEIHCQLVKRVRDV
jgi:hypothetical protein